MTRTSLWLAAGLALAAPIAAPAALRAPVPASEEVRIPLAQFGAIRSFHPVSDDVVYLQGRNNQTWYRATMNGPCFHLQSALRIGLDTRFNGDTLDNSSHLLVEGESCAIASLVRSGPPPRDRH